jgi:mRNA-degrading endonuclease toxin of MazEF toxin-antitoxin module
VPEDYDLLRGTVWEVDFPDAGPKPAVIVSNNARNRSRFPVVHMVRISTAPPRTLLPSMVALTAADQLVGTARCDDLGPINKELLTRRMGALTPATMNRIGVAMKGVLGLD